MSRNRNVLPPPEKIAPTPIAQKLYRVMQNQGVTDMTQLSLDAGKNRSLVFDILRGRSASPLEHTIRAIAAALGVPTTALMNGDDDHDELRKEARAGAEWALEAYNGEDREERLFDLEQELYRMFQRHRSLGEDISSDRYRAIMRGAIQALAKGEKLGVRYPKATAAPKSPKRRPHKR